MNQRARLEPGSVDRAPISRQVELTLSARQIQAAARSELVGVEQRQVDVVFVKETPVE